MAVHCVPIESPRLEKTHRITQSNPPPITNGSHQTTSLNTTSKRSLDTSRVGDSTTSLGSPLQRFPSPHPFFPVGLQGCVWFLGPPVSSHPSQPLPAHSYQNVTVVPVVPFSRYYLNCPVESHYATYNWYHNDTLIKTCNNTHPQPDCFYFIQNVSHTHYGHYICVSEEDGFRQALVKEHLVNQLRFMSQKGQATMTLASWLQLLLMVVLVELFH